MSAPVAPRTVPPSGSEPSFGQPGGGRKRPIAIFRFSPTEGPGYFSEWLDARGLAWQLVALDEGAPVPADPRFNGFAVEAENFESIHNHSAYARIARGL